MPDDATPAADTTPTKSDPAPIKKPGKASSRKRRRTSGKRSRRTSGKRSRRTSGKRSRRTSGKRPASRSSSRSPKRKPGRPPKPAFDVASLRAKLGLSRAALGKLVGVHENSVANWERGATIREKNAAKLREVASGKLKAPRKPGGPPKAVAESDGAIDVAALRSRLGLSRLAFSKLVGASTGSVFNWEHGTAPVGKFVARLTALAAGRKGKALPAEPVAARKRPGRPPKARIVGEVPVVYADVVSFVREGERARVRFGLRVPGERGARCVVDVVVSGAVLGRIEK